MKRNIIEIDSEKCNGCGLCAEACHESAIQMINGKAVLVSDKYCDGLGNCLPACPTDAIKMIVREADDFDQDAVDKLIASQSKTQAQQKQKFVCPGNQNKAITHTPNNPPVITNNNNSEPTASQLTSWPVQLRLVNPNADFLQNSHLLFAADCSAYAYANFHADFMKNKVTIISCPKLDDNIENQERVLEILKNNTIKSITVVRMRVPCCSGIVSAVKQAMLSRGEVYQYREVILELDGTILE